MTCSSSLFPLSSCGKRSWDRSKQHGAGGREGGKANNLSLYIYTDLCGRYRDLCPHYYIAAASGTSQHMHGLLLPSSSMSLSPVPSRCVSCPPIVGYFLFGAVGMNGEGRVFFPTSGPNCLHIVNSESPSPIKQASQAWLYLVMSSSNFSAKRLSSGPWMDSSAG